MSILMENKIDPRTRMLCVVCKQANNIESWDKATLAEADSKEAIDDYISLTDIKAYEKDSDTIYKCPHCGVWLDAAEAVAYGCINLDEYNK